MAWHRQGAVAVTTGSTTVTGTNTAFAANVRIGDSFEGPDGRRYEILNVPSDTVLSIAPAYIGPSNTNVAYAIMPVDGYPKLLADSFNTIRQQWGAVLAALRSTGNYDILPIEKGGTGRSDSRAMLGELGVQLPGALYIQQGMFFGWNANGTGEGNFTVNRGGGAGGYTWRSVNAANTATGPTMTYSYDGVLSVPQLAVTGSPIAISSGGTSANNAAQARTNLGLGSAAIENTVPVGKGGTGSTDPVSARAALGLGQSDAASFRALELYHTTPLIDFHFNNTSADYDVRVINDSAGVLTLDGIWRSRSTRCRTGLNGVWTGTGYNFNWTGSNVDVYIDATYVGTMTLFGSDYRFKKYIYDAKVPSYEQRIMAYRIVNYQRKVFGAVFKGDGTTYQGLIAHEAQLVNPLAVTGEKDGVDESGNARIQQLDPMALITDVIGASKEAFSGIAELKLMVQALTARVGELESQISELKAGSPTATTEV